MDDVERGRATREAGVRALAGDGASASKLLRYLAAETVTAPVAPAGGPAAVTRPAQRGSAPDRAAPTRRRTAGWVLVGLEALIAAGAVGGAVGLIGNGAGIPQDWLSRTPFDSRVIPGLLLAVVAVPTGVAVVAELFRWRGAYRWSFAAGAMQVGWIIGQGAVLRRYFFLQPVVLACGLLVMALAWWVHAGRAARS